MSCCGQVLVVTLTAGWFYYVMDTYYADSVNSLVLPTVVVARLATFVASMFFEVFGMGTTSKHLAAPPQQLAACCTLCTKCGSRPRLVGLMPLLSLYLRRKHELTGLLCVPGLRPFHPHPLLALRPALLQCFIADEEMFKDDPDGAFAERGLKDYLQSHGKAKTRRAAKKLKQSLVIRQESVRKGKEASQRHAGTRK